MEKENTTKVYFSGLLTERESRCFRKIKESLKANQIPYATIYGTKDIWARDYMPIQIAPKTFVAYKYKPDYLSNTKYKGHITELFYTKDSISKIPKNRRCEPLFKIDVEIRECNLILDGGNVVVCGDKIILTDKVFFENRPQTPEYVIGELKRAFGKEVIIIPSDPYEIVGARNKNELPLCHADGVLAPIDDESILIADYGKDSLGYVPQLMNALTPHFKPGNIKHFDFGADWTEDSWVYINFLRVGNIVLMPTVNYVKTFKEDGKESIDPAYQEKLRRCNDKAKQQLKTFLRVEKIETIDTTTLSIGKNEDGDEIDPDNCGGALHCITWEVNISE